MKRFSTTITVDRPQGFLDEYGTVYPISYGYVPGIIAGDGQEQDVYILADPAPKEKFSGESIAIVLRADDQEDKWVAAEAGGVYSAETIAEKIRFIEKYFNSQVILLEEIQ